MLEEPKDYNSLNEKLKYPPNKAYYQQSGKPSQKMGTFLDHCRKNHIPLNKQDSHLYNIVRTNETYDIFRVLLDQAASKVGERTDMPIKLPDGKYHIGWPSRMSTPQ